LIAIGLGSDLMAKAAALTGIFAWMEGIGFPMLAALQPDPGAFQWN
jgi:hypothetical protein